MIIKYIINLLKKEDNVYINELGLFEKQLVSATIKDDVITPPHYEVFFDANGEGNGFAFILKFAEREQKRLNVADTEIREWVAELKNGVLNNKSVEFEGFGTFSKNNKDDIVFKSAWIRELNIDFEGMDLLKVENGKVEFVKIEKPQEYEAEISEDSKTEKIAEITVVGNEEEDCGEDHEDDIDQPKKKKCKWPSIILLIIILMMISLGYFGYQNRIELELVYKEYKYKIFNKKKNYYKQEVPEWVIVVPKEVRPENYFIDHIEIPFVHEIEVERIGEMEEKENLEIIEQSEPIHSSLPEQVNVITYPSSTVYQKIEYQKGNFYVIAGSFVNEKDAAKHIETTGLDKLNPYLLYQEGNNRVRVCIGVFAFGKSAEEYANSFNKNYWILQ
ncbi:MAG: hypothetical protein LBV02_05745 [Bacteroidales bacterium]|jgi:nucleoid DNA-binding protein|nr:hypothetical protein [Bacteroidales bacterium]